MANERKVSDSMGEMTVPASALYGAQTQRAVENFPVSGLTLPQPFIEAMVLIKKLAAEINSELGLLEPHIASGIVAAADQVLAGKHLDQFPVDVFQTGSGTSSNMNVNEVLATLACGAASEASGEAPREPVHPNDHVNLGQSSNDVVPTAIHISAVLLSCRHLLPALEHLQSVIGQRREELGNVVKTGRTHLMDAMPLTLGQELSAWEGQITHARQRIEDTLQRVQQLGIGGTAVGTGINAHPEFAQRFVARLSTETGLMFSVNDSLFESLATQDAIVELSGQLRALAVGLMKIANDLRWMNSGPLAGLGEIELEALQPGSSIMPGKVNPVIPESVAMVCAQVMGNDSTIAIAGQSGNFQLNVMLPLVAFNVLQSIELLGNASRLLADKAIATFKVNTERLEENLARNPILVTALNAMIGYDKAAAIAKQAYREGRPVIDVAAENTALSVEELKRLLDPRHLT
jgi:fumarate hydratase class II